MRDFGSGPAESRVKTLAAMETVYSRLAVALKGVPLYPVLGNHAGVPVDSVSHRALPAKELLDSRHLESTLNGKSFRCPFPTNAIQDDARFVLYIVTEGLH